MSRAMSSYVGPDLWSTSHLRLGFSGTKFNSIFGDWRFKVWLVHANFNDTKWMACTQCSYVESILQSTA